MEVDGGVITGTSPWGYRVVSNPGVIVGAGVEVCPPSCTVELPNTAESATDDSDALASAIPRCLPGTIATFSGDFPALSDPAGPAR